MTASNQRASYPLCLPDILQKRGSLVIPPTQYNFLWVDDFPLFDVDENGALVTNHHPFTAPLPQDVPLLTTTPEKVRSERERRKRKGIFADSVRLFSPGARSAL